MKSKMTMLNRQRQLMGACGSQMPNEVRAYNDMKIKVLEAAAFACLLILVFIVSLCLLIFAAAIQKTELTVTDKRVYGITTFGKRVDLPFDSISAVSMSIFKGIAIGTSSGRIVFKGIGNRDDLYATINKLLIERQKNAAGNKHHEEATSTPDELKKYKDLLDSGIITQEEFDAKKKQLLGL